MFELIFTFFVNIVGDFFGKKFLTFKYAIGFLLALNGACMGVAFAIPLTPHQRVALMAGPNIVFGVIWIVVKRFEHKMK